MLGVVFLYLSTFKMLRFLLYSEFALCNDFLSIFVKHYQNIDYVYVHSILLSKIDGKYWILKIKTPYQIVNFFNTLTRIVHTPAGITIPTGHANQYIIDLSELIW